MKQLFAIKRGINKWCARFSLQEPASEKEFTIETQELRSLLRQLGV